MESQSLRETQERRNAGGLGSGNAVFQEGGRRSFVGLFPELAQVFLQVIGQGQRLIE
jgi:hypothetical protein